MKPATPNSLPRQAASASNLQELHLLSGLVPLL
jgi:hypothetical protein